MTRIFSYILSVCFILTGCSPLGGGGDKRVVAQVNSYIMTVDDLKYELKNMPYDDRALMFMDMEKGRMEYIDRLLEKEMLIQEAQRQGLDKEKDFMKTIENYWEQALLKLLLERKSKEISGLIHVYDNEMEEYYKESGERLPFSKVKDEIKRTIRQKKETEAMNAWVEELRKKSYIKVNKEILDEVF